MINKRIQTVSIILLLAGFAIGGLLLVMGLMAAPQSPPDGQQQAPANQSPPTGTPSAEDLGETDASEVVATVNDQPITRQTWQRVAQLDLVMSRLAGQPLPTAEETLDRLVNEIIVLEGVDQSPAPTRQEVEARVSTLATAWNVTDARIEAALQEAGLTRTDLTDRVSRLLQVEAALHQLKEQKDDLNGWLVQARAKAEIGLYRSLVDIPVEAVEPVATATPAQPAPTAVSQAPTFAPPPDMAVSPYPQNVAPDFTLSQLDGQPLTLSNLRGRPTIINFWATWCPPCRRELPALEAAYQAHRDEIGFIAVDVKEEAGTVLAFVEELGLTFPVVLDPEGAISNISYQVRGLPTTIFVDAHGVVAARHIGPLDEASIDRYLVPLLAPPPPSVEMAADEEQSAAAAPVDGGMSGMAESAHQNPAQPAEALPMAPHFTLPSADGTPVSLQSYRQKSSVVLVFYRGHT